MKESIEKRIEEKKKKAKKWEKVATATWLGIFVIAILVVILSGFTGEWFKSFLLDRTASTMNLWWMLMGITIIIVIPFVLWMKKELEIRRLKKQSES